MKLPHERPGGRGRRRTIVRFSLWGLFVLVTVVALYLLLFRVAGMAAVIAALFVATIGAWLDHRAHRERSQDQE